MKSRQADEPVALKQKQRSRKVSKHHQVHKTRIKAKYRLCHCTRSRPLKSTQPIIFCFPQSMKEKLVQLSRVSDIRRRKVRIRRSFSKSKFTFENLRVDSSRYCCQASSASATSGLSHLMQHNIVKIPPILDHPFSLRMLAILVCPAKTPQFRSLSKLRAFSSQVTGHRPDHLHNDFYLIET